MGQALSATYTLNNGSGPDTTGISDSLGNIFRGSTAFGASLGGAAGGTSAGAGVIGVGFFTTEDSSLATLTGSALVSAFTQFGGLGTFSNGGPAGNRGVFTLGQPQFTVEDSVFAGQNMYLLVGNGTTFENSTEFLVVKNTKTFAVADDDVATDINVTFNAGNSTLLFGSVAGDVRTTNTDGTATPGWSTAVPVPEPSAALLGLLGAVGLIRRRR